MPPERRQRWQQLAGLVLLLGALWGLWRATSEQSFTLDEPYHLVAGLQMHQHGTNTINLDHPPLVKWVAAWPLAEEPALAAPPLRLEEVRPAWMALFAEPATTRRYLLQSRGAVVLVFVAPLLGLLYLWGRRYGPGVGFALLALFLLAPITLPYLPLVMTDAAVSLGFLATVWAAIRYAEAPSAARAGGLGLAFGLAIAGKYSGLLLAPTLLATGLLVARREKWRLAGHLALVAAAAGFLLYATCLLANPVGDRQLMRQASEEYLRGAGNPEVGEKLVVAAPWLRRLSELSPELGQYATGVAWLAARDQVGVFASVAFGQLSSDGRWWYFPALLLVQTPLVLLAAGGAALRAFWHGAVGDEAGRLSWRQPAVLLPALTAIVYFGVACFSRYNLGLRHLLPIFPFLLLPLALWMSRSRPRQWLVLALLALESMALAPLWMSTTNTWWLGAANPTRAAFSAFEYKQTLIALANESRHLAEPLRVFYPLLDPRELHAYCPEAAIVTCDEPLPAGWYAVNMQAEILLPAIYRTGPESFTLYPAYRQAGQPWLRCLHEIQRRGEDRGFLAGTFHLYRVAGTGAR